MPTDPDRNELQQFLSDMVAIERQLDGYIGQQLREVGRNSKVADAFEHFHHMVRSQRAVLESRLQAVGGREGPMPTRIKAVLLPVAADMRHGESDRSESAALHTLYAAFNHAAFGYAMLHAVAHRYFDSQAEGNTADLAEAHLRGYVAAAQEMNQMVSDVTVRELSQRDQPCQCRCPSCALGVCLCASHGTSTVNTVWRETTPSAPSGGLWVRPPRPDSAAARGGLREGDRIVAVDDQEIASDLDTGSMQGAVRKHQSGETIRLRVRRVTGEMEEVTVIRP
jgi:C-terminal processing protease CtpA/Prc